MTEFIFEVRLKCTLALFISAICMIFGYRDSSALLLMDYLIFFFEAWFHVVQAALKLSMEQMIALNSLILLPQIFQTLGLYHCARTTIAPHFQT